MRTHNQNELADLLRNKDIEGLKEYRKLGFAKISKQFQRGFLTKDDLDIEISAIVREFFCVFEKTFGFEKLDYECSMAIYEDLQKINAGKIIDGKWFEKASANNDYLVGFGAEDILKMLLTLDIPAVCFKKISPEIPNPQIRCGHVWNDVTLFHIPFECIDDGGLFSDENPEGKHFNLTRFDGVVAHLRVTKRHKKGPDEFETIFGQKIINENADSYICIGNIDDYYFCNKDPEKTNITFDVYEEHKMHVMSIYAYHVPGKQVFLTDFPRWKAYNDEASMIHDEWLEEIQRLICEII